MLKVFDYKTYKFNGITVTCCNCRGSSENCYVTELTYAVIYLVRCVSFPRYFVYFIQIVVDPFNTNQG